MSSGSIEVTPPVAAYATEYQENQEAGCAILEDMIRQSIFDQEAMPPPHIMSWYVENAAYRFVRAEHVFAHGDTSPEAEANINAGLLEMGLVRGVLGKNKQYGLLHNVHQILRTRLLTLPTHYDATYGGRLPG